jgi:RimJ/RimL family protein N-acetyltransferase
MEVNFRAVQDMDIPHICRFPQNEDELFFMFPRAEFPLQADELKEAINQRRESTVVLLGQTVVGFANFYKWEQGGRCSIGNVIISPEVRCTGIASQLIMHMVNVAFKWYDAKEVSVSCFCTNIAGLLLYPKIGFIPYEIEERLSKNDERLALIHMKIIRNDFKKIKNAM